VSDVAETFRLALCEQNDLMNKIIKERDALAKRVAELETLLENMYHEDMEWAKSDERYRFGRAAVALVAVHAEAKAIATRRAGREKT